MSMTISALWQYSYQTLLDGVKYRRWTIERTIPKGEFVGEPLHSRSDREESVPFFVHARRVNGRLVLTPIDVTQDKPQPLLLNLSDRSWKHLRAKIGTHRNNMPRHELGLSAGHDDANGSGVRAVLQRLILYPWVNRMDFNELQNRNFTLKEIEQGYFLNPVYPSGDYQVIWGIAARLDSMFVEPQGRRYVTLEHPPMGWPCEEIVRTLGDYADGRDTDGRWNDQPPAWIPISAAAWAAVRVVVDRRLLCHMRRREEAAIAAAAPARGDDYAAVGADLQPVSEST
jgi:hypothetical protein